MKEFLLAIFKSSEISVLLIKLFFPFEGLERRQPGSQDADNGSAAGIPVLPSHFGAILPETSHLLP